MKQVNLDRMSVDDLLSMRGQIDKILNKRVAHERKELKQRLERLSQFPVKADGAVIASRPRRKYPRVLPKYRNPADSTQTWSGRGLQPLWLREALKSGKKPADFEIKGRGKQSALGVRRVKSRRKKSTK